MVLLLSSVHSGQMLITVVYIYWTVYFLEKKHVNFHNDNTNIGKIDPSDSQRRPHCLRVWNETDKSAKYLCVVDCMTTWLLLGDRK